MLATIGRRLFLAVPILLVVTLVTFLLVDLSPGDPAALLAGDNASPERVEEVRGQLGLDQSMWDRLASYFTGLLHGDFGRSLFSGQSVGAAITEALPVTLSLTLVAFVLVFLIAIPLGTMAAARRDGIADRIVSACASFFIGVPPFVAGLLLVIAFALMMPLFPATAYVPLSEAGPNVWLSHLMLPGLALALPSAAEVARQLRGALVDVLEQDFIRTQRAKGLSSLLVLAKHGLKNAAPPVLTVAGLQLGRMLGGAVIVEQVFAMPGFGMLAYNSVVQHDYPIIQGVVLVSALAVIVVNILTDVLESMINPRLRSVI
ncbi:ABC transporter permease [Rhodococcus koreensis]